MNEQSIRIFSVRQNNLKNFSLDIPLLKMTVVTGVSGSGKSSLAFDTLYAEGSRRYMESLSTYARQFLEQIPRPDMDAIQNLPPAIALEQRNSITGPRTTLSDVTEIYDYLRLLYSSIGWQVCRSCGHEDVRVNSADQVADRVMELPDATRLYVLSPLTESALPESVTIDAIPDETEEEDESEDSEDKGKKKGKKPVAPKLLFLGQNLYAQGFQRLLVNGEVVDLSTAEGQVFNPESEECRIIVDRIVVGDSLREERERLVEALETAFLHGQGALEVRSPDGKVRIYASQGYSCTACGALHTPPSPPLFSSNSPLGACPTCSGFGEILELDEELVVPDPGRTLRDGAIDPFSKPSYKEWEAEILDAMEERGINSGVRYRDLTEANKKFLWEGGGGFPGVRGYFERMKQWRYKLHVRVFIRRYQSQRTCPDCGGSRLAETPLLFFVGRGSQKRNIAKVLDQTVEEAINWLSHLELTPQEQQRSREVKRQVMERLEFLSSVGVPYLKLNRKGQSLSGGEYQRICLATQLGAKLSQTLYVLDEPSIGLHPQDTDRLIEVMLRLRDHGNTVVVVEHDEKVMLAADHLVELGPLAGAGGGKLIAHGPKKDFLKNRDSLSARYLSGEMRLKLPETRRPPTDARIKLVNCREHNLKGVDVEIPLGLLVAVTGVSGSGKSSLIHDTLYQTLAKLVLKENVPSQSIGRFDKIHGLKHVSAVTLLDQTPIGRSVRSNPATYLKIYDEIRRIFASQPQSARLGLSPAHFSFNVDGGRCTKCQGEGVIEVDMHFMANLQIRCDECDGKRFKKHILEVLYKGKNIDDVLHATVREASSLFAEHSSILNRLSVLESVGLDYLQLGQSLSTLSGGECQRLKIAVTISGQMSSGLSTPRLFIFDEPTTGLHMHDVKRLAQLFQTLVNDRHSVLFIEHNMELVAQADWVIDMGPGGGIHGGEVVAVGTPEEVARSQRSVTAKHLAAVLAKK
jgi:excinuclease ABC subunit A